MAKKSNNSKAGGGYFILWIFLAIIYSALKDLLQNPLFSSICLGAAVPFIIISILLFFQAKRIRKANFLARNSFITDYSPVEFEHVTAELFRRYGYQATVTPQSGDQGIDILLRKDSRVIGVQCKRYKIENKIGPGMIREFVGALDGKGLKQGYFVTTSDFTKTARETARQSRFQIKLINGTELGDLRTRIDDRILVGFIPDTWWYELEDWQKRVLILLFFLSTMAVISGVTYLIMA